MNVTIRGGSLYALQLKLADGGWRTLPSRFAYPTSAFQHLDTLEIDGCVRRVVDLDDRGRVFRIMPTPPARPLTFLPAGPTS